jgi:hypothetical protein
VLNPTQLREEVKYMKSKIHEPQDRDTSSVCRLLALHLWQPSKAV